MTVPRQTLLDVFNAIVLWLVLAFSVGWYYAVTYFAGGAWPLPLPEALAGFTAYYFSQASTHAPLQVLHWLILFPLAGVAWVYLLSVTAPYFGGRCESFTWALWRFSLASLPLSLPGPYLAWAAGARHGHWGFQSMMQVAFRQDGHPPLAWITPLYVVLALIALALQVHAHRRVFHLRGQAVWHHLLLSGAIYLFAVAGFANFAAYPIRYFLEGEIYHSTF
ncbi:MAG: hypothetical protein HYV27_20170 [Candidatus Hydrogenedentes bacterium]|nr:hypothetical protein [Candidatus Hydrogenedentota bacterium]